MPSEIRSVNNALLKLRSIHNLCRDLGFKSTAEFKAFLASDRFKPFFDEYAEQYIYPQQERARAEGSFRARGVGLDHVERRLISGERPGQDKYSCRRPDKRQWDNIDHCALMLYDIREANTKSVQGIFHRKNLSEHEMHIKIWAVVKYQEFNSAPSRKSKRSAKGKEKEVDSTDSGPSDIDESSSRLRPPRAKPSAKGKEPEADLMEEDEDDDNPPQDDPNDTAVFTPRQATAEACVVGKTKIQFDAEDDVKPQQQLLGFLRTEDGSFTGDHALTNGQRMCIENNGEDFNITSRYWKAWTISELIRNDANLLSLRSNRDYASNLNVLAVEEQSRFHEEITRDLEEDLIIMPQFTEPIRSLHDEQQTWMDNVKFQREDLQAACELLSIPWDGDNTIFRTDHMSLSTKMEFWQPVAVKAIDDFVAQEPALGGCVLADMMGIGKTWVVICYLMLHVNRLNAMTPQPPSKPTLILMPRKLIDQWMMQLELIAPGFFNIYKYYGDARRHYPIVGEKMVQGRLTHEHEIFNSNVNTASTIVVSSYSTFTERHGPNTQKKWRVNKSRWSRTASDNEIDNLDPRWPDRLDHLFGYVVLDEAHIIKQTNNKTSICIKWLKANFHILVTATPIPNGIEDWKGYMPFLEHQDAESWWTRDALHGTGFEEDMNPYAFDDGHPAAKLQMTTRATRDWIYANRIDPAMKGLYLSKVWQKCMLRRTYSSQIPFKTGPTIGSRLPKVHAVLINCTYDERERQAYEEQTDILTGALFVPGANGQRRVKWSLAVHRKLQMLTTYVALPDLDQARNLKAANLKKVFEDANFFLRWFDDTPARTLHDMLWRLCRGAPKVRALLRNIRSHVIRDQEKAIIFCQLPAVATFLFAVLRLLQLEVVVLHSFHTDQERQNIISTFNDRADRAQILIMTFAVGGTGLNLQERCFRVHIFESTTNLGIINQAIGRVRRLGNPSNVVYVYEYYVAGTMDDLAIRRNVEKAIPEAAATLNRVLFSEGEGEDADVDIGEWCIVEGQLVKYADIDVDALENPPILTAHELLRFILLSGKGHRVEV